MIFFAVLFGDGGICFLTNFGGVAPNVSIIGLNSVQSSVEIRFEPLIENVANKFEEVREISTILQFKLAEKERTF